jgi:hypothetical protein
VSFEAKYFTLPEFLVTSSGFDNQPSSDDVLGNIEQTMKRMDVIREILGKPVRITSGYRSPAVNKAIGGSPTSDHVKGLAVDFVCAKQDPIDICKQILAAQPVVKFDQLIAEYHGARWVHIGWGKRMRQQVMTYRNGEYFIGLQP